MAGNGKATRVSSSTSTHLETGGVPPDDNSSTDGTSDGVVEVKSLSPLALAAQRYRKDKISMTALTVMVIFFLVAIASPFLVKFGVFDPTTNNQDLLNGFLPAGKLGGISWDHPLGVEPGVGRDLLSRIVLGISLSLSIAVSGAVITVIIGTVMGIVAGFSGGLVDAAVGRLIDLVLSFPSTLILLALSSVVTDGMARIGIPDGPNGAFIDGFYVVIVLAVFGWPPVARLVRGQVLSIREREFVDAAILMGASRSRIYFKEILPNLWAPLLVYFTLLMPLFISAEAALSFLGVGIKEPTPTLGNILAGSLNYAQGDFIYFFTPALLIAVLVVSFNLIGDGARDALDPKGSS